jgi:hypothetical protein
VHGDGSLLGLANAEEFVEYGISWRRPVDKVELGVVDPIPNKFLAVVLVRLVQPDDMRYAEVPEDF